jgi:phospholipase C
MQPRFMERSTSVEQNKRSKWQFVVTGRRTWTWTVTSPDGKRSESVEEFETLAACTSNAAQHGYVAWKTEDERRRELQLGVMAALKRKQ